MVLSSVICWWLARVRRTTQSGGSSVAKVMLSPSPAKLTQDSVSVLFNSNSFSVSGLKDVPETPPWFRPIEKIRRIPAPQIPMTLEGSGDTVPLLSVGRLLCPRACNQSFRGATRLRLDARRDSLSSQTRRLSEPGRRLVHSVIRGT